MNRNEAMGHLERLYRQHNDLERKAMKFETDIAVFKNKALAHMAQIIVGILAGLRRDMIKNEESLLTQIAEMEAQNGKKKDHSNKDKHNESP